MTMRRLQWNLATACPAFWQDAMRECGGAFFHTPPAMSIATPDGVPFYGAAYSGQELVAIAAGVWRRCRFSLLPRHAVLASPPAVRPGGRLDQIIESLVREFRRQGAAELEMQSHGSTSDVIDLGATAYGNQRIEHTVSLTGLDDAQIAQRFTSNNRKHVRRGIREHWQLRLLSGVHATSVLQTVQQTAALRAELRGDPFKGICTLSGFGEATIDIALPWGLACVAAYSDEAPLSAVVLGWANGRAYNLISGSTPAGYQCAAAFWLQWRIMATLAEAGFTSYSLGGVSAAAESPDHPAHGLHRYKGGFGTVQTRCRGAYWLLRPHHMRVHALASDIRVLSSRIKQLAGSDKQPR